MHLARHLARHSTGHVHGSDALPRSDIHAVTLDIFLACQNAVGTYKVRMHCPALASTR